MIYNIQYRDNTRKKKDQKPLNTKKLGSTVDPHWHPTHLHHIDSLHIIDLNIVADLELGFNGMKEMVSIARVVVWTGGLFSVCFFSYSFYYLFECWSNTTYAHIAN